MMENEDKFWSEIEEKFLETENLIRDFRLPEKIDVEIYQLHYLIYGSWPDWGNTIYSFCHFPQSDHVILSIIGSMATLGLKIPKEYHPDFLKKHRDPKNLNQIISEAIKKYKITNEFISAWGEYNFHAAVIISLIADSKSQNYEKKYIKKHLPNLIELYISAFWMSDNWVNGYKTKEDARDDLAERIEEILNSENNYPNWKLEALENMLSDDQSGIKKTYTETSEKRISEMVIAASKLKEAIEIK